MWERARTKSFTGFLLLLLTLALASTFNIKLAKSDFATESEGTVVRVIPEIIEFEGVDVVGQTFLVAVVVENVTDLVGLHFGFTWDPAYLKHMYHIKTTPVDYYPTPVWPSPYPGIMHGPFLELEPFSYPGYYSDSSATLGGPSFNGSGTVFLLRFKVVGQPQPYEENAILNLSFSFFDLARSLAAGGGDIPHSIVEGTVIIHAFPTHELNVFSLPFASIPFTLEGEDERTPYRTTLPQDSYVLEVPATHNQLVWSHWLEDGDNNRTKTILLDADTTLTAVYARPIGGFSTLIESGYFSSWLLLTLLFAFFFVASRGQFRRKNVRVACMQLGL